MKVAFHTYPRGWPWPTSWLRLRKTMHRYQAGRSLSSGIISTGGSVTTGHYNRPTDSDISVMWSWKQPELIRHHHQSGTPLLVLERGFIQPRNDWVSLTWNGFNGRGFFPGAKDNGERFEQNFGHLLRPWRQPTSGNALLIGQVPGDASLNGIDIREWVEDTARELGRLGLGVTFRPHPESPQPAPQGCELSNMDLANDLERCAMLVTFSSTTAVESVLAGVPTWVVDDGSVAAPVAARKIGSPFLFPDRTQWCHDLAWRQWRMDELADGSAWRHALTFFD